jgi:hypothetical protein
MPLPLSRLATTVLQALSTGPEFGYGGGKGSGKRVKESRIIALLREGDVWPMLVTVGPGSLASWMPFRKRLPCFHYEAVLGLKLEKAKGGSGQPYSMIVPRLAGTITEEQGEIARRLYTEPLTAMFSAIPAGAAAAERRRDALVRSTAAACSSWRRAPRCSTPWRYPAPQQGCVRG